MTENPDAQRWGFRLGTTDGEDRAEGVGLGDGSGVTALRAVEDTSRRTGATYTWSRAVGASGARTLTDSRALSPSMAHRRTAARARSFATTCVASPKYAGTPVARCTTTLPSEVWCTDFTC